MSKKLKELKYKFGNNSDNFKYYNTVAKEKFGKKLFPDRNWVYAIRINFGNHILLVNDQLETFLVTLVIYDDYFKRNPDENLGVVKRYIEEFKLPTMIMKDLYNTEFLYTQSLIRERIANILIKNDMLKDLTGIILKYLSPYIFDGMSFLTKRCSDYRNYCEDIDNADFN